MIEVVIFIVVVSAGLAGILAVTNTSVKSSADPLVRKQAVSIAESMLEEIMLKSYADPNGGSNGVGATCTAGTGPNRSLWSSICEYNGYSHVGIADMEGASVSGLGSYNIQSVTVAPPGAGDDSQWVGASTKKITVVVTGPGVSITLSGFRGNY